MPPYGKDGIVDNEDRAVSPSAAELSSRDGEGGFAAGRHEVIDKTAHSGVGDHPNSRREGVSFTKVFRADWIRAHGACAVPLDPQNAET